MRILAFVGALLLCCSAVHAATYYVSPQGDDGKAGTSEATAWATCKKVGEAKFQPGDTIFFQRGGEWHDWLNASSSGAPGNPITYDAYGQGKKPIIWGSEILDNKKFTAAGNNTFNYPIATKADSALQDHVFIASSWNNGVLTITVPNGDPQTDGKVYTACVRGNVILSNRKDHLIFRNLVVDETAGQIADGGNQGYGVRIEGSTDVLVENCEAYRCGRHHFAFINSTAVIGRHLNAAYVQPGADNTIYVAYADGGAPVAKCTIEWDDISADHLSGPFYVCHGDHLGTITMTNAKSDGKISFMSAPVIFKGGVLSGNGSLENFGDGILIDGVTLTDSASIDQYGKNGIIQNCLAYMTPKGAGMTGYSSAIVFRDNAAGNTVRFNTLVTKSFHCLALTKDNLGTQWYGNIMLTDNKIVLKYSTLTKDDAVNTDYNFYNLNPTFGENDCKINLQAWKGLGPDAHSLLGDPKFVDQAKNNFELAPDSPCLGAAKVEADKAPKTDFSGVARPQPPSIGAFEKK